ncbi:SCP-like protein [Ancylostoma duodenale]|uniref:SCP-like protein n=1 Tax=Ancylostoma duodenale TaxID=51022 RepID=A0A0C2GZ48_9BILA|nr:SCP-like protein [Ancylostoma duodenale]
MTAKNRLPQTTAMLSSVLVFVTVSISVLEAGPPAGGYQCWNFASTDEIRFEYLNTVNNLRKKIAEGTAVCKDGKTCPQGKNVYRLEWDCLIEMEAQKVADQCTASPTNMPSDLSALVSGVPMTTCNPKPQFKKTVNGWWNVVTDAGNPPKFDDQKLESFAKLAHGKATRIGCAQKNCNDKLYIACMLYPKNVSAID